MNSLIDLEIGRKAIITEVLPNSFCSKMAEMGIIEGAEVSIEFKAPFGDPIAIELNGCLLSIRKKEAINVIISAL